MLFSGKTTIRVVVSQHNMYHQNMLKYFGQRKYGFFRVHFELAKKYVVIIGQLLLSFGIFNIPILVHINVYVKEETKFLFPFHFILLPMLILTTIKRKEIEEQV